METNLVKNSKIPAGIISGTEAFWENNEMWVSHEGSTKPFHQQPGEVQRMIANAFLDDTESRKYLRKIGIVDFKPAFERWFKCVVGGIDSQSDFDSDGLHPEAYNNTCCEVNCPDRGKLCGRASNLKSIDVIRISAFRNGATITETANMLYLSPSGMKTWWEHTKEKLGTTNTASTFARLAGMGVV
jgi:hypothetical protein